MSDRAQRELARTAGQPGHRLPASPGECSCQVYLCKWLWDYFETSRSLRAC